MPNSVELIDPIQSVSNLPNGIPPIEDLFIFVELLGRRRERSVLTLNSNQGNVVLETQLSNTNINMLGADFKQGVNNSSEFTTKWTDTTTNTTKVLEGFGIERIEVNLNSSFIPSVKIDFVDIRGSAFFNLGDNSPYSLLLDFPPPVFTLTLKGFYGRSLDYDLHLVKNDVNFNSNNGNYYISTEFVARTFAPLSDVPFKFSEIVAIMSQGTQLESDPKVQQAAIQDTNNVTNQEELNVDPRVAPRNTYELVKKLERLTDELKDIKNTSEESQAFDDARLGVQDGDDIINYMDSFAANIGANYRNNAAIIIRDNGSDPDDNVKDDGGQFAIVNSVKNYRTVIRQAEEEGNNNLTQTKRLYLGVLTDRFRAGNTSGNTINIESLNTALNGFRESLITRGINFDERNINRSDIVDSVTIYNFDPQDQTDEDDQDTYICLDVTKFFLNLEKVLARKRQVVNSAQEDLVTLINNRVGEILGFRPTIYNIFKILCDDLDEFFRFLGKVSLNAETHHEKFFNLIIDQVEERKSKNKTKKLYPFPLYIEQETTCGVVRKVRRFPNFQLPEPFPETDFIERFIDTIISIKKDEEVAELRTQIDAVGNNRWIPITPADSELFGDIGYDSPYTNLELVQNVPDSISAVYARLINRFYIASQYTFGESFFSEARRSGFLFWGNTELKRNDLIKYVARAEAVNVANSVTNEDVLNSLIDKARSGSGFRRNPQAFYDEVSSLSIYNTIPDGDAVRLTDNETLLYRNRSNPDFVGMEVLDFAPSTRTGGDSSDPIDLFIDEDGSFIDGVADFFTPSNENPIKKFTTENIPYFDDFSDGDSDVFTTRFLNDFELDGIDFFGLFEFRFDDAFTGYQGIFDPNNLTANQGFIDPAGRFGKSNYKQTLATILALYKNDIDNLIKVGSDTSDEAQAFVLASAFGRARSYFSELGALDTPTSFRESGNVNSRFLNPAAVEVPRFSIYYMGALTQYNENPTWASDIDSLLDEQWFKGVSVDGGYIIDDASKILSLSDNDTESFSIEFDRWIDQDINGGFNRFRNDLRNLIVDINNEISSDELDDDVSDIKDRIVELIDEGRMQSLNDDILRKVAILNFSEYTFRNGEDTDVPTNYDPLSVIVQDVSGGTESRSAAADTFFNAFWERLAQELPERQETLNEIESNFRSTVEDEDIKTQLYYSFKNISDKWISGIDTSKKGFPLNNDENDSLISKFAFVDRAMNPIGDEVIINAESLVEMSQDFDLNMFQVFSRLLSLNGFEFFPLQNFMVFDDGSDNWGDAFRIFTNVDQGATPAFVCMYIGGTSSTLENEVSDYDNDGILDLQGEGLPDFNNIGECDDAEEVIDSENRSINRDESRFKYSEPKAFRVRFAEQNQSFFISIQMEGREFPETADSLAILSRIAGDGTTAPIPKGQNLFNIYENRAYSVTVKMFGNVMIQPTQYFQLENIPMYSGAYMITDVKHMVENNQMFTEFKGVKVLKFPNPFVKNFATIVGIESGTAEDLTGEQSPITGQLLSASTLPNKELFNNSMFDLSISPD